MQPLKFLTVLTLTGCLIGTGSRGAFAQTLPFDPMAGTADPTAEEDLQAEIDEQPGSVEAYLQRIPTLTDAQKSEIQAIFVNYQPQIEAATAEYIEALNVLNNLIAPNIASEAIRRARADVWVKEQAVYDLLFERNLAIRDVLTVDQREEINALLRALLDLGPVDPVATFPDNLIGLDIETAIAQLEADGWQVTTRSPGTVFLDRNGESMDIDINADGAVEEVYLAN